MKKTILIFSLLVLTISNLLSQQNDLPKLTGPYLGQKPQGMTPVIFAPDILSTDENEFNAAYTPDGNQVYFTVNTDEGQSIMMIEFENGTWGKRKLAPFSGLHRDVDPFVTPDGKRLYFSSNRALIGNGIKEDCDFWYVEKLPSGEWGEAKHLDFPATPGKHDFYITTTKDRAIYYSIFNYDRTGDIFSIHKIDGIFQEPEQLGYEINTRFNEHDPFIAPDESYLIFSSDRPGGYGSNDLYISFRNENDSWTVPKNMGKEINSEKYDYCPILSPDGKYLFFSSNRTGNGDVYWVDAKIIEELTPKE